VSAESVPQQPRLDWFRQALSNDPEKLRRFNEKIANADRVPATADDLEDIARLLSEPS
jgi:hypothetical protein